MDWMQDITFNTVGLIIAAGAFGYALHLIWIHMVKPAVRVLKAFSAFVEAQPTLLGIAEEFKPNGGDSLRDRINILTEGQEKILNLAEGYSIRLNNIEQQIESTLTVKPEWDGAERRGNTKDI